jgi:hypothetical protein
MLYLSHEGVHIPFVGLCSSRSRDSADYYVRTGGVYLVTEAVFAGLRHLKIHSIWAAGKEPEPVKVTTAQTISTTLLTATSTPNNLAEPTASWASINNGSCASLFL